jgi:hypothetical protein
MLEYNEKKRPDFIEIHEKLPPYRTVKEYFRNNPEADYKQGGSQGIGMKFDNLQQFDQPDFTSQNLIDDLNAGIGANQAPRISSQDLKS